MVETFIATFMGLSTEMHIVMAIGIICVAVAIIGIIVNFILVLGFGMDYYDTSVIVTMILPWVFILAGSIDVAIGTIILHCS